MTYEKITPQHPSYKAKLLHDAANLFFCDALDHNEDAGCSNPECWKHNPGKCGICGKQMRHHKALPFDLDSDCGGDCWECVK